MTHPYTYFITRKVALPPFDMKMPQALDNLLLPKAPFDEAGSGTNMYSDPIFFTGNKVPLSLFNKKEITRGKEEKADNYSMVLAITRDEAQSFGDHATVFTQNGDDAQLTSQTLFNYLENGNVGWPIAMVFDWKYIDAKALTDRAVIFKEKSAGEGVPDEGTRNFECVFTGRQGGKMLQDELIKGGRSKELEVIHAYLKTDPERSKEIVTFNRDQTRVK